MNQPIKKPLLVHDSGISVGSRAVRRYGRFLPLFFGLITGHYLLITSSSAQTNIILQDTFEDGDLAGWTSGAAGHWTNSTTTPITGSRSLKHNLSSIVGSSYIFTQPSYTVTEQRTVWRFNVKNGAWDPSSDNRFHVYLMASTNNLLGLVSGYAVGIQFPSSGTPDPVRLSRVLNGVATTIITSATDWASSQTMGIEVVRAVDSTWTLSVDDNGGFDNLVVAGSVTDTTYTATSAFGPVFTYTSTRAGQLWLDDISILQLPSPTNVPPTISVPGAISVRVNTLVQFNVSAQDSDGDFISLTASNLPANASFSPSNGNGAAVGTLSFTPDNSQSGQVFTATFHASDNDGTASGSVNITVSGPLQQATNPPPVWINEINYDPEGADAGEFVEVAGPTGFNLAGYSLVFYNGANGAPYDTVALSGTIDNEGICGFGALSFLRPGLQNGPEGIALVQGGTNVLQFLSYEGTVVALSGAAQDYVAQDIGIVQDNEARTPQLYGDGTNYVQFNWILDFESEGSLGRGQIFPGCNFALVTSAVLYVSLSGGHVYPFTNWVMAATNIQDAVDVCGSGGVVLVTNGVYSTGGYAWFGETDLNRVVLYRAGVTVRSVNGPAVTVIDGNYGARCAFLVNGRLEGFTLTNGVTSSCQGGGGAFSWSSATLSNCVLTGNAGGCSGGGARGGILDNCALIGNSAVLGGGAYQATLNNCTLTGNSAGDGGGGAYDGTLNNCTLTGNSASFQGGGAEYGTLNNCTLTDNSADFGGGAFRATLNSCTLTDNSADFGGGGALECTLNNCTLVGNSSFIDGGGAEYGTLNNCMLSGNAAGNNGGGAARGTLNNCTLTGNTAGAVGGGTLGCTLNNCTLTGNSAGDVGGGAYDGTLNNCMLSGNSAGNNGGGLFMSSANGASASSCIIVANCASNSGGGAYNGNLYNCTILCNTSQFFGGAGDSDVKNSIIYYNVSLDSGPQASGQIEYSCMPDIPAQNGNITNAPLFVDLAAIDVDLQNTSPCIDAGQNESRMTNAADFAGRPRIMNGRVDMGAHEFRFEADLRALLAGAFTGGGMRVASNLPTNSPYAADASFVSALASNAVDWVLVELRPTPTSPPAVSVSALLRNDGQVIQPQGDETIYLEAAGNQHIALFHRNHLAVMSDSAVFTSRLASFDFTTNVLAVLNGTNGLTQVESNAWALIAGDADGDGEIMGVDSNIWQTQRGD